MPNLAKGIVGMRKMTWLFLLVGALILATSVRVFAQDPATTPEPEDTDGAAVATDSLARGEYLVRVAGACVYCHATGGPAALDFEGADPLTVDLAGGAPMLSGNIAEEIPYGVVYASNLTMLGEWSDEAIENAIRYGVRPDGSVLLPPMPYDAYETMSDEDMAAVIAYLKSLTPVEMDIPEAELEAGVTRETARVAPEIDAAMEHPALAEDATLEEQGAYLGQSVAACIHCHGSVTEDGRINVTGPLAGETLMYTDFGITPAPSLLQEEIGQWPDEGLINFINGIKSNGDPVFIMPVSVFKNLTQADKEALVAWLRTQP